MSKKRQPVSKPLVPPAPPASVKPKRSLKAPPKPQRPQKLTYEQARRQVLERIVNEKDERFWHSFNDLVQEEMIAFGEFYESEEEAMLKVANAIVEAEVAKLIC